MSTIAKSMMNTSTAEGDRLRSVGLDQTHTACSSDRCKGKELRRVRFETKDIRYRLADSVAKTGKIAVARLASYYDDIRNDYITIRTFLSVKYRLISRRDVRNIGCIWSVYLAFILFVYYCRMKHVMNASSDSEKDVRRELYKKKKQNKKDKFSKAIVYKPVRITGRKLEVIPTMTLEELEIVMKKVPKNFVLEPSSLLDLSVMDKFRDLIGKFDSNKMAVNKIMALFESISLLALNLYQATTRSHQVSILLMWVQNRFASDKSLLLNMTELVCWFSHFKPSDLSGTMKTLSSMWSGDFGVTSFVNAFSSVSDEECLVPNPGTPSCVKEEECIVMNPSSLPEVRLGPETVGAPVNPEVSVSTYTNSETVRRFKALIQMFVDAGMCSVFGYDFDFSKSVHVLDWVNTATHRFEMVEFACSTIMYFLERGYAAYDARNIKYLFFSNDFVHAELEFRELENDLKMMYGGDGHGDVNSISRLENKIVKLRDIYKKDLCTAKASQKFVLSDRIGKMNQMIIDVKNLHKKVGQRKAPYAILFYGLSGVGKSWCTGTIVPSLLHAIDCPTDPYYIRTINQSDDYDTMIDNSTLAIQVDDIANGQPGFEKKNPLDCILRFMNNVMCPANKADLKDKGRVFISPFIVVCTTNAKSLNAVSYSIEPISMLRRFDDHVTVMCDAKYMTDQKLDLTKWPEYNKRIGLPPLTFKVERVTGMPPATPGKAMDIKYNVITWSKKDGTSIVMDGVDWTILEPYLNERAQSKMAIQERYLSDLKRTQNPLKCKCGISFPNCKKHEADAIVLRAPVRRMLWHRRRNEECICKYRDRNGDTCSSDVKGRVLRSCYWRKKFRISNYTSLAFNAIIGIEAPKPIVEYRDRRYWWIDSTLGNKNRKFKDLTIVVSQVASVVPLVVNPSSAYVVPQPQLRVSSWIDVDDSDDEFSDADTVDDDIFSDTSSLPDLSDYDSDSTESSIMRIDTQRYFAIDTDTPNSDDSISDTGSDSDYDRSYNAYMDYEDGLDPSAGQEDRKLTPDEQKVLDNWLIVVEWWDYLKDIDYRSRIDLDRFDGAFKAVVPLIRYNCGRSIPISLHENPICVISPENPGFFDLRDDIPDGEIAQRTQEYMKFRRSILVCQNEVNRVEELSDDSDDDDPEFKRFDRACAMLQLCKSGVLLAPFRFGGWLTRKTGSELSGVISGFSFNVISCLFSVSMCFSIPSLFLGVLSSILVSGFWCIMCTAMYIGSTKLSLINFIRNFGDVREKISHYSRKVLKHKYHVVFGSIAVLAIGTMFYRNRKRKEPIMTPSGSQISVPVAKVNERSNNYWTANKVSISASCGVSGYQNTPEEMINTIAPCVLRVRVYPKGIKSVADAAGSTCETTCAILMHGGLLVVPNHLVSGRMGCLIHAMRAEPGKVRNNADWILNEKDYYHVPGTDFAFLYTNSLGPSKDVRRFLPKIISKDAFRAKWYLKDKTTEGKFPIVKGNAILGYDNATLVKGVGIYEGYNFSLVDEFGIGMKSEKGWCMSPLVSATNPSCIHSFYLAGIGETHRSAPILESYVNDALEFFKNNGRMLLPSSGVFAPPEPISDNPGSRSPLSHLDKCEEEDVRFDYYGSRLSVGRRFCGKVRDTPFAPYIGKVFGCLHRWSSPINIGSWKPWWTNLFNMGVKVKPFDPILLDIAQDDLRESLLKTCSDWRGLEGETFQDVVFPVSMETAVNGVSGVSGCDRVKMNTSAGYPFCCSKSKVISEVPDDSYPCGVRLEPNEEVKKQTEHIFECARNDERSNIVFTASVKDEPTLPTKEKVRVFAGCPVSYLIAVRMMTSMLVKFMTDNHLAFFTVAGANAHDYDWTLVGAYLAAYSVTNCIAGDYSDYDKKILAMLMVRAVELTCDMLRLAGYTEDQILICKNLMLESCYPIYEWNGDFINVCGTNPSGQPLTVWLNNLVNLLYQRYVFYTFYSKDNKFDDCVRILVMGDDNIMSVKPGYEKYNHTSIKEVLENLGMKYTMADKTAETVPYIPLEKASLLKRSFIWSDDLECYLAPIEEKSIYRCLSSHMLANGDNSEAVVEHCGSMVDTALSEWFYFGEDVYNDRLKKMYELLGLAKMEVFGASLKSYKEQLDVFKCRILDSRCLYGIKPSMKWVCNFVRPVECLVEDMEACASLPASISSRSGRRTDKTKCRTCPVCQLVTFLEVGCYNCDYRKEERRLRELAKNTVVEMDASSSTYRTMAERRRQADLVLIERFGFVPEYGCSEWQELFEEQLGFCYSHDCYGAEEDCDLCYSEFLYKKRIGQHYGEGERSPDVLVVFEQRFKENGYWKSGKVTEMEPSGGYMGYDLNPEYGFREVFVGRKHETHVDYGSVVGNRRSLVIVDCYQTSDLFAVPKLFESGCWIATFGCPSLGIHHGSYFDDNDPRVLYRRGDWVLVIQDGRLNDIYIGSLGSGKVTHYS